MPMRLPFIAVALCAITACAPSAQVTKSTPSSGVGFGALSTRGMIAPAAQSGSLERDFMDLSFTLESGQDLAVFTRFEGPISVALAGPAPPTAARDLAALVGRLQREAGIDIAVTPGPARVTVEFVARGEIRRLAPQAACFVVPNAGSLAEYRSRRGRPEVDWARIMQRDRAAIFIPADTSPQEMRDCLHEELAQALGPLNDLYRLSDSVFNDDNFHSVLTGFDMDILRLTYSPRLQSGLSAGEVAARLGAALPRRDPSARPWSEAIETSLGGRGSLPARQAAAERALALAVAAGWQDSRLAFSHFAVGRLHAGSDPARALAAFQRAAGLYARLPGGAVRIAHIDMQLAAMALAGGLSEEAARLADRAIPEARRYGNLALATTLMLIQAEALERQGDSSAAAALRLDSQPLARYGYGPDKVVRDRMRDIATLADRAGNG